MIFGKRLPVSDDERRSIHEFDSPGGGFSVQQFLVKKRLPLGKHAHREKFETFVILKGRGVLLNALVTGTGAYLGPITRTEVGEGSVIHIGPYDAHTFYLEPGSEMICFSSKAFDKNDFIQVPGLVEERVAP